MMNQAVAFDDSSRGTLCTYGVGMAPNADDRNEYVPRLDAKRKEKEKKIDSKTLAFNALGPRHHSRRDPKKDTRKNEKGKKDHP
jgi:hypothetical protein